MSDTEPQAMTDPPLMVTAGALGNEDRSRRRNEKEERGEDQAASQNPQRNDTERVKARSQ